MILPKEIVGQNRLRDLYICNLYIEGTSVEQIVEILETHQNQNNHIKDGNVYRILRNNSLYIEKNIAWSKSKRLHRLYQVANNAGIKLSAKKDILNVFEQIRKEIEGDKPLFEQHTHYTTIKVDINDDTKIPLTHEAGRGIQRQEQV